MTSPDRSIPSGALVPGMFSELASMSQDEAKGIMGADILGSAQHAQDIFHLIYNNPITSIITGITGAVFSFFDGLFGAGGSQSFRGFAAPPPPTQAASGVIDSVNYLAEVVATLQSGAEIFVYEANSTFHKPPGAKTIELSAVGGSGGGGQGARNTDSSTQSGFASDVSTFGAGGGPGGWMRELFDANDFPDYVTMEIGLGGAGNASFSEGGGIGGHGMPTIIRRPDGEVLLSAGGGFGGGPGYSDAPSDFTRGVAGYGNQGSFGFGGSGAQGPGVAALYPGIGFGAVITAIPARATPAQNGFPGPFSPGGAAPTVVGGDGNPGEFPLWMPPDLDPTVYGWLSPGPGSGGSGGMHATGDGVEGGRGGDGVWGGGGGGGGSGEGNGNEQRPGPGGHGSQGVVFITVRYS